MSVRIIPVEEDEADRVGEGRSNAGTRSCGPGEGLVSQADSGSSRENEVFGADGTHCE